MKGKVRHISAQIESLKCLKEEQSERGRVGNRRESKSLLDPIDSGIWCYILKKTLDMIKILSCKANGEVIETETTLRGWHVTSLGSECGRELMMSRKAGPYFVVDLQNLFFIQRMKHKTILNDWKELVIYQVDIFFY